MPSIDSTYTYVDIRYLQSGVTPEVIYPLLQLKDRFGERALYRQRPSSHRLKDRRLLQVSVTLIKNDV